MRKIKISLLVLALLMVFCVARTAFASTAEETTEHPFEVALDAVPLQYAFVSGDNHKFQAHHWRKENYVGGFKNIETKYVTPEGYEVEMSGSAMIHDGDYSGEVSVKKEGLGYLKFEYEQFRKYYDDTGGAYYPFSTLSGSSIGRELYLDIGKIAVIAGVTVEDFPEIELEYEHGYKEGAKSRLAWASATEPGLLSVKIAPAWMEIDEVEDVFVIRLKDEVFGFDVEADQRFEFVRSESTRHEKYLTTTTTAANSKYRTQTLEPESDLLVTTLKVSRWFLDDKIFTTGGYQFQNMNNTEIENIREMTGNLSPFNYSNAEQIVDARADNRIDLHRLILNVSTFPWDVLDVGARLKAETSTRDGNSNYPSDNLPNNGVPNGVIDHTEFTNTDSQVKKLSEAFSIRYKGISKTAIYSEVELEQNEYWLSEDRNSVGPTPSTGEIFIRETTTNQRAGNWTLGVNYNPSIFVRLTSQLKYGRSNNDYENKNEAPQGATALIDSIDIVKAQLTNKITFNPFTKLRTSFRHIVKDYDYYTRAQSEETVDTDYTANTFVYDVTYTPRHDLFLTGSFTKELARTNTPANTYAKVSYVPGFKADYTMWMFNAAYTPKETVKVDGSFYLTNTDNYDDFTAFGLPYGSEFTQMGLTFGVNWDINKDVTIHPGYSFYTYQSPSYADVGNYHAHIIAVESTVHWG